MAKTFKCPECRMPVKFNRGERSARCPECETKVARPKSKSSSALQSIRPRLTAPVLGVMAAGLLLALGLAVALYFQSTKKKSDPPTEQELPTAPQPTDKPKPTDPAKPVAWHAVEDPRPPQDHASYKLPGHGADLALSPLGGRHIVVLASPMEGATPVHRVHELATGKVVADIPKEFDRIAIDDNGLRFAASVNLPLPPGLPKSTPERVELQVLDIKTLKPSHRFPFPRGYLWADFGKSGNVLFLATSGPTGTSFSSYDLKSDRIFPKPLPSVRPLGRSDGAMAVSPNRTFLAVAGETHIELFDTTTAHSVGTIDAPGRVTRLAFTGDGKELLVLSTTPGSGKAADARREIPLHWTTYSLATGQEVRKIENTGFLPEGGPMVAGFDPGSVALASRLEYHHFDLAAGASFETVHKKLLGAFDEKHLIVYDAEKEEIQFQAAEPEKLAAARQRMRTLLGERPAAAVPDAAAKVEIVKPSVAWSLKPKPAPVREAPSWTASPAAETNCEFVFPRADQSSWSAIQLRREEQPRLRYALAWAKLDPATGKQQKPVELWPCAVEPGRWPANFGFGALVVDQTASGDKLALRDPKSPARLDIWNDAGQRLIGFEPGSATIDWLAWAEGDRLLTLSDGTLTGWDGPKGKAIYRLESKASHAYMAPTRDWVAITAAEGIEFYSTADGSSLGRLAAPAEGEGWTGFGLSPDGSRFSAAKSRPGLPSSSLALTQVAIEYGVWDLASGKSKKAGSILGTFAVRRGTILHELSEKQLLVGTDILDLELNAAVASISAPLPFDRVPSAMIGARLWLPLGTLPTSNEVPPPMRQLQSHRIPGELSPLPKLAAGDIVFRPGATVKVTADLKDAGRSKVAKELYEEALDKAGFKVGDGGWTLDVSALEQATPEKLSNKLTGSEIAMPAIAGVAMLVGPDGTKIAASNFGGSFENRRGKYCTATDRTGWSDLTKYNFGGRDPKTVMAEEAWNEAMANLPRSVKFPHVLAKIDGKPTPIPVIVGFK